MCNWVAFGSRACMHYAFMCICVAFVSGCCMHVPTNWLCICSCVWSASNAATLLPRILVNKCTYCCWVFCSLAGESGATTTRTGMPGVRPRQHPTGITDVSPQSVAVTWRRWCGSPGSRRRSRVRRRSTGWFVSRVTGRGCVDIRHHHTRSMERFRCLAGDSIIRTTTRNLTAPNHFLQFTLTKNISDILCLKTSGVNQNLCFFGEGSEISSLIGGQSFGPKGREWGVGSCGGDQQAFLLTS